MNNSSDGPAPSLGGTPDAGAFSESVPRAHQTRVQADLVHQTRVLGEGSANTSEHTRDYQHHTEKYKERPRRELSRLREGMAGQPRVTLRIRKDKHNHVIEHSVSDSAETESKHTNNNKQRDRNTDRGLRSIEASTRRNINRSLKRAKARQEARKFKGASAPLELKSQEYNNNTAGNADTGQLSASTPLWTVNKIGMVGDAVKYDNIINSKLSKN